jgi:Domain of unknown function (DUF4406)
MFDVYIAGGMTGRRVGQVLLERATAKAMMKLAGLTWYDPAEDEGLEKFDDGHVITTAFNFFTMKSYASKDFKALTQCRSVLNLTGDIQSDGAGWEMAYAVWQRQIPVVMVAPKRHSGELMGFTNIMVDKICPTLPEAIKEISNALLRERNTR